MCFDVFKKFSSIFNTLLKKKIIILKYIFKKISLKWSPNKNYVYIYKIIKSGIQLVFWCWWHSDLDLKARIFSCLLTLMVDMSLALFMSIPIWPLYFPVSLSLPLLLPCQLMCTELEYNSVLNTKTNINTERQRI